MRTSHEEACPEIGPICAVRDEPPQVHDQRIWLAELRLTADYAFDERFSAAVTLPLRLFGTSIVFRDLAGNELDLDYENIHHRDETLVGPADPMMSGAIHSTSAGRRLGLRLGATLPLGRTEEDPFRAAAEGRSHEHSQFGTGTVIPLAAFDLQQDAGFAEVSAFALGLLSVYENVHGFRPGHRLAAGFAVASGLGLEGYTFRSGLEVQGEGPETWAGTVHTSDGNQGRVDLLISVGARADLGGDWAADAGVRIPVYTYVVGGQLAYPGVLELGLSRAFAL